MEFEEFLLSLFWFIFLLLHSGFWFCLSNKKYLLDLYIGAHYLIKSVFREQ